MNHIFMSLLFTVYQEPLQKLSYLDPPQVQPDKLGFDEVYVINLKRRPDRKEKMDRCLAELGVKFKYVEAVDGK